MRNLVHVSKFPFVLKRFPVQGDILHDPNGILPVGVIIKVDEDCGMYILYVVHHYTGFNETIYTYKVSEDELMAMMI